MEQEIRLLRQKVNLLETKLQELQNGIDKKVNDALRKFFECRARHFKPKTVQFEEEFCQDYFSGFEDDLQDGSEKVQYDTRSRNSDFGNLISIYAEPPDLDLDNLELESPSEYDGIMNNSYNEASVLPNQEGSVGRQEDIPLDELLTVPTLMEGDDGDALVKEEYDESVVAPPVAQPAKRVKGKNPERASLSRQARGLPYFTTLSERKATIVICDGFAYTRHHKNSKPALHNRFWRCQQRWCKARGVLDEEEHVFHPGLVNHTCPRRDIRQYGTEERI